MEQPLLSVSESATRKLQEMVDSGRLADSRVRVSVQEEGAAFRYELKIVEQGEPQAGDALVDSPAVQFLVDPISAELLRGATLDFVESIQESGFKFDNPNRPKLLDKPLAARIQQVLEQQINPSVASHGGHVKLVDVQEGRVFLQLGGGCQGCGMADVTLRQGIEETLRREIPEITEILDTTDHAAGENPYYQGA